MKEKKKRQSGREKCNQPASEVFSTVKIWVIWKNTAESATLPPPLNLIYWAVPRARGREEEAREGAQKRGERRRRKWRGGVRKARYEERQRRRGAAGERFIRGDGFSRRGRRRAKETEGWGQKWIWKWREGRRRRELSHCLPTTARSWILRPLHQTEGEKRVQKPKHVLIIDTLQHWGCWFHRLLKLMMIMTLSSSEIPKWIFGDKSG